MYYLLFALLALIIIGMVMKTVNFLLRGAFVLVIAAFIAILVLSLFRPINLLNMYIVQDMVFSKLE